MQLVVIGTGLIGCSFALAARSAGLFTRICGIDASAEALDRAVAHGHVDATLEQVPAEADAVLVAVPPDRIAATLDTLATYPGVVFDVASVKAPVVAAARAAGLARFVPCHPIAGSERSGPDAAMADLFRRRKLIITPYEGIDPRAVEVVSGWWSALGCDVQQMPADAHDARFARTSHLPHLVAFAYMQMISDQDLQYAAGGFRDFSRIAASDADMWVPILAQNGDAIVAQLDQLSAHLAALRAAIVSGDSDAVRTALVEARARRRAFEDTQGSAGERRGGGQNEESASDD